MSIFNFKDSRPFLRDYIAKLPKKGRGEASRLAKELGVSTTLISQILAEEKSLTPEQAQVVSKYLGLAGLEYDYFTFLIQWERAGSPKLKSFWSEKLDSIRSQSLKVSARVSPQRVLNDQERAIFYSTALYSAVHMYTSVGDKGKTLGEIARRFELSLSKAAEILNFLKETGICAQNGDHYTMGVQSTHLEQGSPHLLRHHANWRMRAVQRSEDLQDDELMYTANVSLSKEDFSSLRESMVGFIKQFLRQVHSSPAEEIAVFNLDFLWVKK